jgi:hemerythrin superfamily protein
MAENRTRTSTTTRPADPLAMLKADHREVEQLLTRLADSEEGAKREQMVSELQAKLSLHMQLEEQLLYPLVAEMVGQADAEEAEIEHTLARDGLDKVVSMVAMPGFGAVVEMLKAGIKHHVEEEEKEILPELKEAMDRDEWRALGEQIKHAKEAAGTSPTASGSAHRRRSSKRKVTATR